jgi:prefoldin subunit 5
MRNPFRKRTQTLESLISILLTEIDEIDILMQELRKDLQDLTDFVEDNLD